MTFSYYGLALAVSAAVGCAAALACCRDRQKAPALFAALSLALPLGLLGARLLYAAVNAGFFLHDIQSPLAMARIREGGLSLTGALALACLAALPGAKIGGARARDTLAAMAPGLLVFAAGARLSEWVIGAGYGPEASFSLPLLTRAVSGSPRLNTALLMALCALALVPIALRRGFSLTAFCYGASQLLLESLRRDGHMLWGFVHAEQAAALAIAFAALLCLSKTRGRAWLSACATLLVSAAIVALEFALDRSNLSDTLLYAVYALAVGGYMVYGAAIAGKKRR